VIVVFVLSPFSGLGFFLCIGDVHQDQRGSCADPCGSVMACPSLAISRGEWRKGRNCRSVIHDPEERMSEIPLPTQLKQQFSWPTYPYLEETEQFPA
jgi:hypothetical protein